MMPQPHLPLSTAQALLAAGFFTEVRASEGHYIISVWVEDRLMNWNMASFLAARIAFDWPGSVYFHSMGTRDVQLHATTSLTSDDSLGVLVTDWLVAANDLPKVVPFRPVGVPVIDQADPSTSQFRGFLSANNLDFASNKHSGKWCVIVEPHEVDEAWAQIKALVEFESVPSAIVSTSHEAHNFAAKNGSSKITHVICVFNQYWYDFAEVKRVRDLIRDCGIKQKLGYKRDSDTQANIYKSPFEFIFEDTYVGA